MLTPDRARLLLVLTDALEVAVAGVDVQRPEQRPGLRDDVASMLAELPLIDLRRVAAGLAIEAATQLVARQGERPARRRVEQLRLEAQVALAERSHR